MPNLRNKEVYSNMVMEKTQEKTRTSNPESPKEGGRREESPFKPKPTVVAPMRFPSLQGFIPKLSPKDYLYLRFHKGSSPKKIKDNRNRALQCMSCTWPKSRPVHRILCLVTSQKLQISYVLEILALVSHCFNSYNLRYAQNTSQVSDCLDRTLLLTSSIISFMIYVELGLSLLMKSATFCSSFPQTPRSPQSHCCSPIYDCFVSSCSSLFHKQSFLNSQKHNLMQ